MNIKTKRDYALELISELAFERTCHALNIYEDNIDSIFITENNTQTYNDNFQYNFDKWYDHYYNMFKQYGIIDN